MTKPGYDQARETVAALNRLMKRSARRRRGERRSHFERDLRAARSLFTDPNILGFGVGPKISGRESLAPEISLVFFVRRKLPKSRLRYSVEIPQRFLLRTTGSPVQTDIQVWGNRPVAHSTVSAGSSIGDLSGNSGTMTLAVNESGSGDSLILSCSHVLARCGNGNVGDEIESPADITSNPGPNVVGTLRRFTIIDRTSFNNAVDAAVAAPINGVTVSNNIPGIGIPAGIRDLTKEGDTVTGQVQVQRVGVASGFQTGTISNIHVSTRIAYPQLDGDPSVYFTELVQYSAPSEEGDSGAAVVDDSEEHNVVGMHIAGMPDGSASLFTHIQFVLDRMSVAYQGAS